MIELRDEFWAPRVRQLRERTLPVILDRFEEQGVIDNFRRLAGDSQVPRRAMHFSDSDLYKWVEACALAGCAERCDEVIGLFEAVQAPDGYVHTYYGIDGGPSRYSDLVFGHEHYCAGHLIEAAVSHHEVTGSDRLLIVATRIADHLCDTFGAGRDERTDAHPEIELALCRLAGATGQERYLEHASWIVERQLADTGMTLENFGLGGHAVRALYLSSAIAEIALATGNQQWTDAARRLFDSMVDEHAYPTGAVGGRWLGEAVGRPFEQPDGSSYAESCAAVAALQFSARIRNLTGDPRAFDQEELVLFNALPCGVGSTGDEWFYSQPHAVGAVVAESNPWVYEFDYGQIMLREWFPAHRHRWFDVPCCPPNLARAFAGIERHIADVDDTGDLRIHIPLAGHIRAGSWDVVVGGDYPAGGQITVSVQSAPSDGRLLVRRPGWAGGDGHEPLPESATVSLPVEWEWWTTSYKVEGAAGMVHLRRGPVVFCAQGVDNPDVDLRDLVVDPVNGPGEAFAVRAATAHHLHQRWGEPTAQLGPATVTLVPYSEWANGGTTTMQVRFPTS